ncbi:peptidylprolyl isomerase [Falsihalocynthiibacter sp. SS001]|uniref:FKBP-type peptidyl-prolyl cis-trans isomerase n=1 Tax=Falsihalocynthiibacter sp. SS001 TaxID=3349698 RepID=UPI0036D25E18
MTVVKDGDKIALHYTGTLADGSVFDSSEGREPLEFTVGSGQVIKGLDKSLPGMAVGDKKTITAIAEEAYGPVVENARQPVPRDQFPDDIPMEIGTQLQMQTPQGEIVMVTIAEVAEDSVVLDANHPLAGKDLTFAIELVSIS